MVNCGSRDGTVSNNRRLAERSKIQLQPGDKIELGPFLFDIRMQAVENPARLPQKSQVMDSSTIPGKEKPTPEKTALATNTTENE